MSGKSSETVQERAKNLTSVPIPLNRQAQQLVLAYSRTCTIDCFLRAIDGWRTILLFLFASASFPFETRLAIEISSQALPNVPVSWALVLAISSGPESHLYLLCFFSSSTQKE